MTPTVNVNEHTTYTNLLHILHNYGTEWPILCWCAVKKLLTHWLHNRLSEA